MNYFKYLFTLFVFISITFCGCYDKSSDAITPASVNPNVMPSLAKTSGPGAWIFRFENTGYAFFYDVNTGLFVTIGVNDIPDFCSDNGGLDIFEVRNLVLPNSDPELRRVLQIVKGSDKSCSIWKTDSPPVPTKDGISNFISTNTPIATGTAALVYTDNNLNADETDGKNSDAFGYKVNGTLQGQDGQLYKLNLVYRFVWNGVDPSKFKETTDIMLTPTGN
jgi:hypothetical protein